MNPFSLENDKRITNYCSSVSSSESRSRIATREILLEYNFPFFPCGLCAKFFRTREEMVAHFTSRRHKFNVELIPGSQPFSEPYPNPLKLNRGTGEISNTIKKEPLPVHCPSLNDSTRESRNEIDSRGISRNGTVKEEHKLHGEAKQYYVTNKGKKNYASDKRNVIRLTPAYSMGIEKPGKSGRLQFKAWLL